MLKMGGGRGKMCVQGVIFEGVREDERAVEGVKGADGALSLGGKVERGGSRKEKKGARSFLPDRQGVILEGVAGG